MEKSRITLWYERKNKLRKSLVQWGLDDKKYITSWQMVCFRQPTHTLLQRTWNVEKIQRTSKPCTQKNWIPIRHKVKIVMPLLPSNMHNKPYKQHIHKFTDRGDRNGLPSISFRSSTVFREIRRHIQYKTAHSFQENSAPTQMASFKPYL